jgi:hypothetical protein
MALHHLDNKSTLETRDDEMRDFARVVRNALLMIVRYLEKRYHLCG